MLVQKPFDSDKTKMFLLFLVSNGLVNLLVPNLFSFWYFTAKSFPLVTRRHRLHTSVSCDQLELSDCFTLIVSSPQEEKLFHIWEKSEKSQHSFV